VLRAVATTTLLLAACGGGDEDPADALADRVVAVLEADGDAVDGDLSGADVRCPEVREPDVGDRATCTIRLSGDRRIHVDVEFEEGGAIAVVAVIPG
jgi:hypothetical protein